MNRLFISHATDDRNFIETVVNPLLITYGIFPWMAEKEIKTASDWEETIRRKLEYCEWFMVVISKKSIDSKWVKAELNWAIEERENRIIPFIIEDCNWKDIHLMIRSIQAIHFRNNQKDWKEKLLSIWGIEMSPSFIDANPFMVGRLSNKITKVYSEYAYKTFWVSSENHSIEFFAEYLDIKDFSNRVVDMKSLINKYIIQNKLDEPENFIDYSIDYDQVSASFALKSGNLILSHSSYVRDRNFEGFSYINTKVPQEPKFTATYGYKNIVLLVYPNGEIYLHDTNKSEGRYLENNHSGNIIKLDFSRRTKMFSITDNGEIGIWELPKFKLISIIKSKKSSISSISVNKDSINRVFATGDSTGIVSIWTFEGDLYEKKEIANEQIVALDFFGGTYLAISTSSKLFLWNYNEKSKTTSIDINNLKLSAMSVVFPIDRFGRKESKYGHGVLIAGCETGEILSWEFKV